jgi:FkbM family methyltransferase
MTYLERIGNWLLPNGILRDFVRSRYRRRSNPLYSLVPLIASIDWIEDNVVHVRLRNGLDLCGYADQETRSIFEYADPQRLGPLQEFGRCTTFLQILGEEFVDDIYLRGRHLRSAGTVLDLGAHVGAFTVKASREVGPLGLVVALEPFLPNRQLLDRNVRENDLGNVRIVPKGAWRASAQLPLHLSSLSSSHTLIPGSSAVPSAGVVENVVVDSVDHNRPGRLCQDRRGRRRDRGTRWYEQASKRRSSRSCDCLVPFGRRDTELPIGRSHSSEVWLQSDRIEWNRLRPIKSSDRYRFWLRAWNPRSRIGAPQGTKQCV